MVKKSLIVMAAAFFAGNIWVGNVSCAPRKGVPGNSANNCIARAGEISDGLKPGEEVSEMHSNQYVTLKKPVFSSGEEIEVKWHGLPGQSPFQGDWINIVPKGSPDRKFGTWWYTRKKSGSRNIGKLEPGKYEVKVYFDYPRGGYAVKSKLLFTVE